MVARGSQHAVPIDAAVAALGSGPLTEGALQRHVAPLFSRVRAAFANRVYLANHSLGRPLDATDDDVREGIAAWYARMGGAWEDWDAEMRAFRRRLALLLHAPRADCVVPKSSAGQGLRAILNTYDSVPRVVASRSEFDSLDVILREYARRGRIALTFVEPREDGAFDPSDILAAIGTRVDLVVVSQVIFTTGQRLDDLPAIVAATHRAGGRLLLDVYHALGVFPVDVAALGIDFAVGGSYKYLRGGPGACFLYLHPRHLDGSLRTLDTGWFAKRDPFAYARPEPPSWNPRRRCCRSTRRALDRSSRWRWASSVCARIRSACNGAWPGCCANAASARREAATTVARSSSSPMTVPRPGRGSSRKRT